jgi:hypothetical protein
MTKALICVALALVLTACSDDETAQPPVGGSGGEGGSACADEDWQYEDGSCAPLPFSPGCPPGSYELDGSCAPAGVPPELCGIGFEPDGDGGCLAITPDMPCGDGMMAALGETTCRPVADCGQDEWGAIVTDSDTQFVDASYSGGANDGSQSAPWTSIQQGIDAAFDGATVAVAAGSYTGNIDIDGKSVRIWGRCPSMVELIGTSQPAIFIRGGADGVELRSFALVNDGIAIMIASSQDVVFDEMWIHDGGNRALQLDTLVAPASVTIRRSLIERASDVAVLSFGADVVLEDSEVRDTRPAQDDRFGRALALQVDPDSGLLSSGLVRSSILRNNRDVAIWAAAATLTIEDSWIVDTQPRLSDDTAGVGIGARAGDGVRSSVEVRSSIIERQHQAGAYALSSDIAFDGVVIRDIEPQLSNGEFGRGVTVELSEEGVRPRLDMSAA